MGKRKLEIENYLTISTGHIREETARKLEEGNKLDYIDLPIDVFDKGKYGWWIRIPDDITEGFNENKENAIPSELWECMLLASKNGCRWLCLDCDGMTVDGLSLFDW